MASTAMLSRAKNLLASLIVVVAMPLASAAAPVFVIFLLAAFLSPGAPPFLSISTTPLYVPVSSLALAPDLIIFFPSPP